MNELIDTLTGWLPDGIEPYAQVLLYLGVLGVMSVVPLLLWLGWAARPRRSA
ncbi:MAG: hypothetical protein ACXWWX_07455 [Actinomycetota bacterium]